jgi:hypothetical protein
MNNQSSLPPIGVPANETNQWNDMERTRQDLYRMQNNWETAFQFHHNSFQSMVSYLEIYKS